MRFISLVSFSTGLILLLLAGTSACADEPTAPLAVIQQKLSDALTASRTKATTLSASNSTTAAKESRGQSTDERISKARKLGDELANQEAKVSQEQDQLIQAISKAVDQFKPSRIETAGDTLQSLRPVVQQLRDDSRAIIDRESDYFKSMTVLHASLSKAPAMFRAAGDVFAKYAQDEPFKEIRSDYENLAESWQLLADGIEKRDADLKQEATEMHNFKSYLERTCVFLERLDSHLASFPKFGSSECKSNVLHKHANT